MSLESILTIGGLEQRPVDGRERARDQGENEEDSLERERERIQIVINQVESEPNMT